MHEYHNNQYQEIVTIVESAVLEAARYLHNASVSGVVPDVTVKADKTLVMNLDLESQRRVLAKLPHGAKIVAEEDETSHDLIHSAQSYFLVDPLDGTTSCKRFLGQFGGQVGYGPLVGYVHKGQLVVASFYNVPQTKLFTAVAGGGTYVSTPSFIEQSKAHAHVNPLGERRRLQVQSSASLIDAGVLFLIGHNRESEIVQLLRDHNAVENFYRFGGFANDCSRLAQGFEQLSVQFAVKPWDLTAVLLPLEAGLEVWLDPLGKRIQLRDWRIAPNNPLMIMVPGIRDELFALIDRLRSTNGSAIN